MPRTEQQNYNNDIQGVTLRLATGEKPVNKRAENRRENLRRLIQQHGGPKAFAALVEKPQSFISQMCGPHPTRGVSDNTARAFEQTLGLQEGALDWPREQVPVAARSAASEPGPTDRNKTTSAVIAMLIGVMQQDAVTLDPPSFGDLASFAIADAINSGKLPSPDKLRGMIAMTKART